MSANAKAETRYFEVYERWKRDPEGILGGGRARYRLVRTA